VNVAFSLPCAEQNSQNPTREVLGNHRGQSQQSRMELGWVSALDLEGRTTWIVDTHGYGKRFMVHANELVTAFVELERAICIHLLSEEC
jgi:hypothetical protein